MTSNRMVRVTLVFAVMFLLISTASAQVKYAYKSSAERKQNERVKNQQQDVKKVQNEIKEDAKELSADQQALRQAQAKEAEARHRLSEVRKRVETRHRSSVGLDDALADQLKAQAALDDAKTPILKNLRATPDYQHARDQVVAAKARLTALREDSSLTDEARKKSLAEASQVALAVSELEQKTLDAAPTLKSLHDKLANAQDKVAKLHAKLKDAVEADSEVKADLRSLHDAMRQTEQAKAAVAKESRELAGDQAKLAQEQAQLDKAKHNAATHINTPSGRRPRTKRM